MATKTVDAEVVEDTTTVPVSQELVSAADASTQIATPGSDIKDQIRDLVNGAPALYSSYRDDDFKTKLKVLNAIGNSQPIAEAIGTVIELENILVQIVTMKNETTQQMENQPRIILVDKSGTPYHAISKGLWNSVQTLIGVAGEPHTWEEPINIVVKRHRANNAGHFFAIEYV